MTEPPLNSSSYAFQMTSYLINLANSGHFKTLKNLGVDQTHSTDLIKLNHNEIRTLSSFSNKIFIFEPREKDGEPIKTSLSYINTTFDSRAFCHALKKITTGVLEEN